MSSISFFHTGFVICLAGTILFLVITAVLFFAFDIRTIFSIRSGRAQAKTVKEMEAVNSSTGRLRTSKNPRASSQRSKKSKPERETPAVRTPVIQPPVRESAASPPQGELTDDSQSVTEKLGPNMYGEKDGQYKNIPSRDQADETVVLGDGAETTVLPNAATQPARPSGGPVYFEVVKKIIRLDTEEVIG